MYVHLNRNFKKWPFYSVKILKCESVSIALLRDLKKLSGPFKSLSVETFKSGYFYRIKNMNYSNTFLTNSPIIIIFVYSESATSREL